MIRSAQIKVEDSAAVALAAADVDGQRVVIRNMGEDPVFVGGSSVTASTGFQLAKTDAPIELELDAGEVLGARCAEGKKATVHVLRTSAR